MDQYTSSIAARVEKYNRSEISTFKFQDNFITCAHVKLKPLYFYKLNLLKCNCLIITANNLTLFPLVYMSSCA